ncbi:MAG: transcriptional regulator [Geobacteraceae bacterium GWC2_58_44]|nr:MAG: transcriptional regulator [Geobacteraceae bacterium GWC2_58_44]HBG06059.1 transcriptional regulator [Geobacter sp.]
MNGDEEKILDTYRSFLLLSEISGDEQLSQRELAKRLGIALGLVNSYLKNLVSKGFVRVSNFPKNRYAYLLTPKGFAEKSRLAYQHLSYFSGLYTVARQDYLKLFHALSAEGVKGVAFCGIDEVAEIAYLSLKETGMELELAMDVDPAGRRFFDRPVLSPALGLLSGNHRIVITSLKRGDALCVELLHMGVDPARIYRTVGGGLSAGSETLATVAGKEG